MEQRRKIVIPTGAEPAETPPTPHFDTEAAKTARPVVPLDPLSGEPGMSQSSTYVRGHRSAAPYSPWLLALVVIAAASVGAAAALAIDYYRNHNHTQPAVVTQPASPARTSDVSEKAVAEKTQAPVPPVVPAVNANKPEAQPSPSPSPAAVASESPVENTARPKVAAPEPPARETREREAAESKEKDATKVSSPEVKAKKVDEIIIPDDKKQVKERRRRQSRETELDPQVIPRQVQRADQELHRIREIFEGPRP